MKKTLLLLTLGMICLGSCREKQNVIPEVIDPVDTTDTTNNVDSSYVINGITNYTVKSLASIDIPLELSLQGHAQEKITLSINGLPANTSATFTPSIGYPGFSTILNIKTIFTKPGKYPITITGTSESKLVKSYMVDLVVEKTVCDSALVYHTNYFRAKIDWNEFILYGGTHMEQDFDDPERYRFSSLLVGMDAEHQIVTYESIYYYVDCDSLNVIIPSITVSGTNRKTFETRPYTVEGSGKINVAERKIVINYTSRDDKNNRYSYEMYADIIFP